MVERDIPGLDAYSAAVVELSHFQLLDTKTNVVG